MARTQQPASGAARPDRLGSRVYERIKERLLQGRYTAGERIAVEDLRREFEVSRQPVMTALHQLANEGLVEVMPQVGCRAASYSLREVEDFFDMFGGFEGTIAAKAAVRRTDEQLERLAQIAAETEELCLERSTDRRTSGYYRLNRRFHGLLHEMADSWVMVHASRRMWDLADFLINTSPLGQPIGAALEERHADHERIRRALVTGDAQAARAETEHHIVGTLEIIAPRKPKPATTQPVATTTDC